MRIQNSGQVASLPNDDSNNSSSDGLASVAQNVSQSSSTPQSSGDVNQGGAANSNGAFSSNDSSFQQNSSLSEQNASQSGDFFNSAASQTYATILGGSANSMQNISSNQVENASASNTAMVDTQPSAPSRIGPDATPPLTPVNSIAPPDIDPPYKVDDIIHMSSGNTYRVVDQADFKGDLRYVIERVNLGDDGAPETWEQTYTFPDGTLNLEDGKEHTFNIRGYLNVSGDTGQLTGSLYLENDSTAISASVSDPLTGKTVKGSNLSNEVQAITEQEHLSDDLQELMDRSVLQQNDRGDIKEPHPEDIDIGPTYINENGTGSGHGSSGGGGGGFGGAAGGGGAGGWGGVGGGIEGGIADNGPLGGDVEPVEPDPVLPQA